MSGTESISEKNVFFIPESVILKSSQMLELFKL